MASVRRKRRCRSSTRVRGFCFWRVSGGLRISRPTRRRPTARRPRPSRESHASAAPGHRAAEGADVVPGLVEIDWSRPWLVPYRGIGMRVAARVVEGASVAQALNEEAACAAAIALDAEAPRFVAAALLPPGVVYE